MQIDLFEDCYQCLSIDEIPNFIQFLKEELKNTVKPNDNCFFSYNYLSLGKHQLFGNAEDGKRNIKDYRKDTQA